MAYWHRLICFEHEKQQLHLKQQHTPELLFNGHFPGLPAFANGHSDVDMPKENYLNGYHNFTLDILCGTQ